MNRHSQRDESGFDFVPTQTGWTPAAGSMPIGEAKPPRLAPTHPKRHPQIQTLTPIAEAWLAALPPQCQPLVTAQRYPHIVNRLSALWDLPAQLPAYFDDLLLSARPGGRGGFPFEVVAELSDLQTLVAARAPRRGRL